MMRGDDLEPLDRIALESAMRAAMREPHMANLLQSKLIGDVFNKPENWGNVAKFAAYVCQCRALNLKTWQDPPCVVSAESTDEPDKQGQKLLRKMLDNGLSRYEPDPLRALQRNAKRIARLRKM
jgi:hypothetical protein